MTQQRQSIKLSIEEWQELNNLAIQTRSIASRSKNKSASWRTLLKRIARGELVLVENSTLKLVKND